jgi:endonuclease III
MSSALKQRVIAKLCGVAKKADESNECSVLERMVYAVCREGVSREAADTAYHNLLKTFFDLNEVRVSAAREVARAIENLPDNMARAERIIAILQEIFETTYAFDLETLHKKGLKQAQKMLERYRGSTPFMVSYVLRHSMDGHAVPIDDSMLRCLRRLELVDADADSDAAQGSLESMVPKAKGMAFAEGLSFVAHRYCFEHSPKCPSCQFSDSCPSAVLKKAATNGKLAVVKVKK